MITNNNNTPDIMLDVLDDDVRHDVGASDYSATSLVQAPQMLQLKKRYGHQIVDDAMDRWYLFVGNAMHEYIEKNLRKKPEKYLVEHKLTEFIGDRKVVAIPDVYDLENDVLYDHKSTTSYSWNDEPNDEYVQQLNINAWFLRKNGKEPKKAALNMMTKDWSAGMAKFKGPEDYPPNPMWEQEVPLWSEEDQKKFIDARLELHKSCEGLTDEQLPPCTEEEMWAKPNTYAVKKRGVYVAKRVLPTLHEAEDWMALSKIPDLYIEERKGERTRCEKYCRVNKFCKQYQKYLEDSK